MPDVLLVGVGGLLGAVLRYLVGTWVQAAAGGGFPYGTLTVNAVGCFIIGLVAGLAEARQPLSTGGQAFLVVGLLGGFTTFSAFGIDTIRLFRDGDVLAGAFNVALQVAVGLSAVGIAFGLAQWTHGRLTAG
jgi:CrcB protein